MNVCTINGNNGKKGSLKIVLFFFKKKQTFKNIKLFFPFLFYAYQISNPPACHGPPLPVLEGHHVLRHHWEGGAVLIHGRTGWVRSYRLDEVLEMKRNKNTHAQK